VIYAAFKNICFTAKLKHPEIKIPARALVSSDSLFFSEDLRLLYFARMQYVRLCFSKVHSIDLWKTAAGVEEGQNT